MARTDEPPSGFLEELAPQLGRFLVASFPPEAGSPLEQVWSAESFQVWTVTLEEFLRETDEPLRARARWTGVWHLQLRSSAEGPAIAFTRWLEGDGGVDLRSSHISPLAGEIDRAVRWIDGNLPSEAWLVRLLEIPNLQLPMLWLENGLENRFRILVEESFRNKKNLRAEPLYSEAELRSRLKTLAPIRGLTVP